MALDLEDLEIRAALVPGVGLPRRREREADGRASAEISAATEVISVASRDGRHRLLRAARAVCVDRLLVGLRERRVAAPEAPPARISALGDPDRDALANRPVEPSRSARTFSRYGPTRSLCAKSCSCSPSATMLRGRPTRRPRFRTVTVTSVRLPVAIVTRTGLGIRGLARTSNPPHLSKSGAPGRRQSSAVSPRRPRTGCVVWITRPHPRRW